MRADASSIAASKFSQGLSYGVVMLRYCLSLLKKRSTKICSDPALADRGHIRGG